MLFYFTFIIIIYNEDIFLGENLIYFLVLIVSAIFGKLRRIYLYLSSRLSLNLDKYIKLLNVMVVQHFILNLHFILTNISAKVFDKYKLIYCDSLYHIII